jgi:FkbM family methyltransferase
VLFTPLPKALIKAAINYRGQRRAMVREQFFRVAGRFTSLLVAEQDELRFLVRTDDLGVGREMFTGMSVERKTLDDAFACLEAQGTSRENLRSGWFVDIGANIGTASITAVAKEMVAGAICVEPLPDNQQLLKQNRELNRVADRIRLLPFAVSAREGEVTFELSADNWGDGRVRVPSSPNSDPEAYGESERRTIEVRSTTLDALVARGEVDPAETALVWIDAQGHEAHIFSGGRSLFRSGVPAVAEFWPYGLRRAGGLERLCELGGELFSEYIDLGKLKDPRYPNRQRATQLHRLAAEYDGLSFTDLLLLP